MLGVAIPGDIDPDLDGSVHPQKGGMSVSPGSMWHVPSHRRPYSMARGSTGPLTNRIYAIGEEIRSAGRLTVRPDPADPGRHAFVEPSQTYGARSL